MLLKVHVTVAPAAIVTPVVDPPSQLELLICQPGMNVSVVARKYEVHPNQLFRWRRLFHEGALTAVRADEELVPCSEVKELKMRIRELERMLGRKTMETEILKDALEIAREKKLISRIPLLKKDDTR